MKISSVQTNSKLVRLRNWLKGNWQIVLFWIACVFAGSYLGTKGYGLKLYFGLTGIDPKEWTPIMRQTALKDPKVGSLVSLDGLTDWQGNRLKLPFQDKMTGLIFACAHCGAEEKIRLFYDFLHNRSEKIQIVVVWIGQFDSELKRLMQELKGVVWARDPKLSVFERLNALYMPRFYLVSSDGTLRYLSPIVSYLWIMLKWQKELRRIDEILGR